MGPDMCIDDLSQNVFRARLQNGKWELHSLEAKTIFGPFESLEVLFSAYEYNRNSSRTFHEFSFLASQNGTTFIIDEEGEKISNPTEIKRIKVALAYEAYTHNEKNVSSRGIKIEHKEPDFKVTALYEQLYDILLAMDPKTNQNISLPRIDERKCACPKGSEMPLKHELSYTKQNAASVTVSRYFHGRDSWDVGYYTIQSYVNVILVNGEMKQIDLRAIFGNNDQLLYNEFVRAIKADETLDLECSTVNNMLEIIQNNYRFSDEGLVLIVQQNSKRSVNVTIPWERLAQVSATKSFAGIFMD